MPIHASSSLARHSIRELLAFVSFTAVYTSQDTSCTKKIDTASGWIKKTQESKVSNCGRKSHDLYEFFFAVRIVKDTTI